MFNYLTDKFPYSVNVAGEDVSVNPSAGNIIRILEEQDCTPETVLKQLRLFYPKLPKDIAAAYAALIEFIAPGKPSAEKASKTESERSFSYSHDSGLIFAAFLQQYGIRDISSLHWYEFKALLSGLTEDCLFSKIVGYRTIRIDGKMSKESKAFYRKMKRLYALPPENGRKINDAEICAIFDKI